MDSMFVIGSLSGTPVFAAMCTHLDEGRIGLNADGDAFPHVDALWDCMHSLTVARSGREPARGMPCGELHHHHIIADRWDGLRAQRAGKEFRRHHASVLSGRSADAAQGGPCGVVGAAQGVQVLLGDGAVAEAFLDVRRGPDTPDPAATTRNEVRSASTPSGPDRAPASQMRLCPAKHSTTGFKLSANRA
jgi:hypothetical protein